MRYLLVFGLGGLLLFGAIVADGEPTRSLGWIWAWPVLSLVAVLLSSVSLLRTFLKKEAAFQSLGRIFLSDLFIAMLLAGLCGSICASVFSNGPVAGAIATIVVFVLLVIGLVAASKSTLGKTSARWIYAFSFALKIYGAVTVAGLVGLILIILCNGGFRNVMDFLGSRLFSFNNMGGKDLILWWLRSGCLAWPVGWLLCRNLRVGN